MINKNTEHLVDAASLTIENTHEFMQTSLESIEKLTKLQFNASKKVLEETSQAIKEISAVNNPKDFFEQVNQLVTHSVKNNIDNCRELCQIVQDTQAKVKKMIEVNIQTSRQNVADAIQDLSSFNPAANFGSSNNIVSESVTNWLNGANQAMTNMGKMASQISDFANSSIKAVSAASTAEVKKATARK